MSIPTGTPHTLEEHRQFYDDMLSLLITKLTDSAKIGDTIKTQFYAECIEYLSTFIRDGNPVFPLYLQRHEKRPRVTLRSTPRITILPVAALS